MDKETIRKDEAIIGVDLVREKIRLVSVVLSLGEAMGGLQMCWFDAHLYHLPLII